MELVSEVFPDLITEIKSALIADGREDLVVELCTASLRAVSFDSDSDAGYIAVDPLRTLNVVEQNIIGARYDRSYSVHLTHSVTLDIDNFDRLMGIELLSPPAEVKAEMLRRAAA